VSIAVEGMTQLMLNKGVEANGLSEVRSKVAGFELIVFSRRPGYRQRSAQQRPQMQFFTDELYETGRAHAEYERYWQTIAERMPRSLLLINGGMLPPTWFANADEPIFLHDARIRSVDRKQPNITLHLHGHHHGALREIFLHYSDVGAKSEVPDRLLADTPDSDLMCHETTALQDGRYSHKMLFANGDLLSIEFSGVEIEIIDHPLADSSSQEKGRTQR
jgi:hypothetical protein